MQFLLENPMPQELHFLAGLNNTVGIGKVRVVAVWHIDVTQCCDGQIYQFSYWTSYPTQVDVKDDTLFLSISCCADILYAVSENIVLAKPISFKWLFSYHWLVFIYFIEHVWGRNEKRPNLTTETAPYLRRLR